MRVGRRWTVLRPTNKPLALHGTYYLCFEGSCLADNVNSPSVTSPPPSQKNRNPDPISKEIVPGVVDNELAIK